MASSDVTAVVNYFARANEGFTTTTSSSTASGAATVALTAVTSLTNGSIFVGIVEPGTANEQVFTGVVDTSGLQITGVKWTRGTNVIHASGAVVVDYITGTRINMIVAGLLVEHTQAGRHVMTSPKVLTGINDTNNNELFKVTATASAVNEITVANAATGAGPTLSSTGGDTNIDYNIATKGTGVFKVNGNPFMHGAWTAYTPVVTLAGGTTNGNAVITGAYTQIGKTVHFWVNYALGSTTSFGGLSDITCTLPVTAAAGFIAGASQIGVGSASISGTAFQMSALTNNTTTFRLGYIVASFSAAAHSGVSPSAPGTWVAGSSTWNIMATYEVA